MLMFLFTHDLFCKQLSYEIQEIRDSLFALHRYLDGGFACLLVFLNDGINSWAVASGDFKVSAKPERKDIPWATKSFG